MKEEMRRKKRRRRRRRIRKRKRMRTRRIRKRKSRRIRRRRRRTRRTRKRYTLQRKHCEKHKRRRFYWVAPALQWVRMLTGSPGDFFDAISLMIASPCCPMERHHATSSSSISHAVDLCMNATPSLQEPITTATRHDCKGLRKRENERERERERERETEGERVEGEKER